MADENTEQVEGQELDTTEQDSNTTTSTSTSEQDSPETFDRDYVEKLRREAASYRTELKDAKEKLKNFEDADLSERQKLQKKLDEAQKAQEAADAALRQERARLAIVKAASKHGLPAELAEKLVEVEFDDEGNPTGVEAAVKKLASEYPQLVQGNGTGSPTNPASKKKTTLTREDVEKMSADEINERWDEVKEVVADL